MDDRSIKDALSAEAEHALDSGVAESDFIRGVGRRQWRRRLSALMVTSGLIVSGVAAVAWVQGTDRTPQNRIGVATTPTGCPTLLDSVAPPDGECEELLPEPAETNVGDVIFVYFQTEDSSAYERGSYQPRPRPVGPEQSTVGRIRAALNELVKGPTPLERQSGVASIFSSKTAGIVREVRLDDQGNAVVDLAAFAERIPTVAAADAGAHFISSLNQTIFQFPGVQSVDYRVGGDCQAFWDALESDCRTFSRAEWEAGP